MKPFIVWICVICWSNSVAADQTLVFATSIKSDTPIASEIILKKAYKKLGYDIEVRSFPSARSLHLANAGAFDGELQRLPNTDRLFPNLVPISVPIHTMDIVVFGKTQSAPFNSWESLFPYHIGLMRGHLYAETAIERHPQLSYEQVIDPQQLLKMLSADRVDYAVLTKWTGLKTLKKLQLKEISLMKGRLETYELFHYLNKKNKHLKPELEKVLNLMLQSGEIEKIRTAYFQSLKLDIE